MFSEQPKSRLDDLADLLRLSQAEQSFKTDSKEPLISLSEEYEQIRERISNVAILKEYGIDLTKSVEGYGE